MIRDILPAKRAEGVSDNRLVYLVTGSQGEPMAVLSHCDGRSSPPEGKGAIRSSSLPHRSGNETAVYRVADNLFDTGAEVIYPALARVHVSGHAYRDELREMIRSPPQYVIPTLASHACGLYGDLAVGGVPRKNVHRVEIGDVTTISNGLQITGQVDER